MRYPWRAGLAIGGFAVVLFALVLVLQWTAGGYASEFGGHPDEAGHYVTGLMVRDYVAAGCPGNPMRFARDYYEHYPKVALGHWPPGFYLLQTVWSLPFGVSRASLLGFMAVLTTALAILFFRMARSMGQSLLAAGGAVLLVCLPLVQQHAGMVMTEIPMAIWTLLAGWSWARFLERGRYRDSLLFGVCASGAILTKGTGLSLAFLPPLSLLFLGSAKPLRTWAFWAPAGLVLVLCGPWTAATLDLVRNGWLEEEFSLRFVGQAVPYYIWKLFRAVGVALSGFALAGVLSALCGARNRQAVDNRVNDPVGAGRARVAAVAAVVAGGVLFQFLVPCGLEPRHLVPFLPPLLLLAVGPGAAVLIAGLERAGWRSPLAVPAVALLLTVGFGLDAFTLPQKRIGGFAAVAEWLGGGGMVSAVGVQQARAGAKPATANAERPAPTAEYGALTSDRSGAILISSDARGEGMFISEVAMRERRPGRTIRRASKLLADSKWTGAGYQLRAGTIEDLLALLAGGSVRWLVLDDSVPSAKRTPHQQQLWQAVTLNPERFRLQERFPAVRDGRVFPSAIVLYALEKSPR